MRYSIIVGIALIVAGAFFLFTGGFTSRRDVLEVGGLTLTAEERHPITPWLSSLAILGGLALVAGGSRRKA